MIRTHRLLVTTQVLYLRDKTKRVQADLSLVRTKPFRTILGRIMGGYLPSPLVVFLVAKSCYLIES